MALGENEGKRERMLSFLSVHSLELKKLMLIVKHCSQKQIGKRVNFSLVNLFLIGKLLEHFYFVHFIAKQHHLGEE